MRSIIFERVLITRNGLGISRQAFGCRLPGTRMHQVSVDFRAHYHLYQIVINVTNHYGLRGEFDVLGRTDVTLDKAIYYNRRHTDLSFDGTCIDYPD